MCLWQRCPEGSALRLIVEQHAGQRHIAQTGSLLDPQRTASTPPPLVTLLPKKRRDVILKVWHTDPLRCPPCQHKREVRATDSAQKSQTFPSEARSGAVPEATPDTAQGQGRPIFGDRLFRQCEPRFASLNSGTIRLRQRNASTRRRPHLSSRKHGRR